MNLHPFGKSKAKTETDWTLMTWLNKTIIISVENPIIVWLKIVTMVAAILSSIQYA